MTLLVFFHETILDLTDLKQLKMGRGVVGRTVA